MVLERVHIPTYSVGRAVCEQVGDSGYRLILVLVSSLPDYPIIRLHCFRTRDKLTETLMLVRDLSDGFISTTAETFLLSLCKPIAENIFSSMKAKDRRYKHIENETRIYNEAANVLPC